MKFTIVIPVYNRPEELAELLQSLADQSYKKPYEVVVVEDGSQRDSTAVVDRFREKLNLRYFYKENSGPGDSRNYGMKKAKGDYFIILDSDCILPPQYMREAERFLDKNPVECFGGPDTAHASFTAVQKAINYAMTSFLTTGGLRGAKTAVTKFQARSFNMCLSRKAFDSTGGFGGMYPGEDPDLVIRLWKLGFDTPFAKCVFVYHKRRISWEKFYIQTNRFGMARAILNQRYPHTAKISFWFPTVFTLGLFVALMALIAGIPWLLLPFIVYFLILAIEALAKTKSSKITWMSLFAVLIQFTAYGTGFLRSNIKLRLLRQQAEKAFPQLFFNNR